MKTVLQNELSAEKTMKFLKQEMLIENKIIKEKLTIESNERWKKKIVFENCLIEDFSGIGTHFQKLVVLKNCILENCQFTFAYFFGGLIIENCKFINYLDFQAGGHNKNGNGIKIVNNEFYEFVNFFDCYYEDEIEISQNKFRKGTNLLGTIHNISVSFDKIPIIKDNEGKIDLNNEGEY